MVCTESDERNLFMKRRPTLFWLIAAGFALVGLLTPAIGLALPVGDYGEYSDPDDDCRICEHDGKLELTVPGGCHDLNPTAEVNKVNAPRILREVDGDFAVQVRVLPFPRPADGSQLKDRPLYQALGLLFWVDNKTFLRWQLADNGGKEAPFWRYDAYKDGKAVAGAAKKLGDDGYFIRLERTGGRILVSYGVNGEDYEMFANVPLDSPRKAKVGVFAVNVSKKTLNANFDDYQFIPGGGPVRRGDGNGP
jgi:regulation of enolase protein 1 (concanavalin A-like superfamily)